MISTRHRRHLTALSAAVVLAVTLTACSSGSSDSTSNEEALIELPAEFEGRPLQVTVISGYPPLGFQDENGEFTGLDYDMAVAIADKIGVEVEITENGFENGLLGVEGDRYDWTGGAGITAERLEKYDMVSYFETGDALAVLADAPDIGTENTDLCGLSIGALSGDRVVGVLESIAAECEAEGLDDLDIQTFPKITDAQLATQSGNVDGWYAGKTLVGYTTVATPGVWKLAGPQGDPLSETGIVTRKDSGLAEPIAEALNQMIEDGTYAEIMEKWGMTEQLLDVAEVNPTPLFAS